jgi:hypothetical protein
MRLLQLFFLVGGGLVAQGCGCGDDDGTEIPDGGADGGDEDGGDGGRIPGRAVRIPSAVEADVGAIVTLEATIVAGEEPWATTLTAEAPRFVYIEGQPAHAGPLSIDSVRLEAGQQKGYRLRLQTLRTWDHTITLRVHGQPYEVPIHPRVRPPLIGVEAFGCEGPHELAYGPDCGPCGPETTSAVCAASQPLDTCHPVGFRIPEGVDEEVARAACDVGAALPIQVTRDVPASFTTLAVDPGELDVTELEWVSGVMEAQTRTRPLPTPGVNAWWMQTCSDCANADGSRGPFDPANTIVFDGLEMMGRTVGGVRGIAGLQIANAGDVFALVCPCVTLGQPCVAATGPSQPACAMPDASFSEELGEIYGPLVAAIAERVGAGVHAVNPEALVITAPLDDPNRGLSPLSRWALISGMEQSVDAFGIVSAPMPAPTWIDPLPDCAVGAPGCETAPPFTDWQALLPPEEGGDPVLTTVSAVQTWRAFDAAVDPRELQVAMALGQWDDLPLWVSSLRAGFHGTSPREVIAAFRAAAIYTATEARGLSFAFPPTNPEAYELLVRTFSGAHPVERPETPDSYDDLVVRFFSRPGQDVMVLWNNAENARIAFVAARPLEYLGATLTIVDAGEGELEITSEDLNDPNTQIDVAPLSEFAILTVDAEDELEFRWVDSLQL